MGSSEADAELAIAARRDVGGGMSLVRLGGSAEMGRRVLAGHRVPGQYVTVTSPAPGVGPSFFVLANAVGAAAPEILLRGGDEVSDRLTTAPLGTAVTLSGAQGAGFPCALAVGRPLWIAVAGTGLAAARGVAAFRRASGEQDVRGARLFVGVRRLVDLPLRDELDELQRVGMAVTVCLSREDPPTSGSLGSLVVTRGYVQDALPEDTPAGVRLFVAGPGGMLGALRSLAVRRGLAESDVHVNY